MKPIYEFVEYREYLLAWIAANKGHTKGLNGKLAAAANVSSTMMSLVLKGEKNLTNEQAVELADFTGLTEDESEYFLLLVDLSKAGTEKLRRRIQTRLSSKRNELKKISKIAFNDVLLSEEVRAHYSSWLYTGVRHLVGTGKFPDALSLSKHLDLPVDRTHQILHMLLEKGFLVSTPSGLKYGPSHIHVEASSPFVNQHHRNWRDQASVRMEEKNDKHLFYTCPMSLSNEAYDQIRLMLPQMIEQILKIVGPSDSEKVACLNIDWFTY